MNCTGLENDLALYAGGDLADGRAAKIASHVAECAACRTVLEDLQAGRSLLAEGDRAMEAAMAAQVRRRVMAEIGQARATARPGLFGWRWAVGLAAALIAVAMFVWPPRLERLPLTAQWHLPVPPVWSAPAASVTPAVRVARAHHRVMHRPLQRGEQPMLVQFVTDNPNLVLYWIVGQKSQGG